MYDDSSPELDTCLSLSAALLLALCISGQHELSEIHGRVCWVSSFSPANAVPSPNFFVLSPLPDTFCPDGSPFIPSSPFSAKSRNADTNLFKNRTLFKGDTANGDPRHPPRPIPPRSLDSSLNEGLASDVRTCSSTSTLHKPPYTCSLRLPRGSKAVGCQRCLPPARVLARLDFEVPWQIDTGLPRPAAGHRAHEIHYKRERGRLERRTTNHLGICFVLCGARHEKLCGGVKAGSAVRGRDEREAAGCAAPTRTQQGGGRDRELGSS